MKTIKSIFPVLALLLLVASVGVFQLLVSERKIETSLEDTIEVEEMGEVSIEINEEVAIVVLDKDLNILFEGSEEEVQKNYENVNQLDVFTEIENKKYFIQ